MNKYYDLFLGISDVCRQLQGQNSGFACGDESASEWSECTLINT